MANVEFIMPVRLVSLAVRQYLTSRFISCRLWAFNDYSGFKPLSLNDEYLALREVRADTIEFQKTNLNGCASEFYI